MIRFHFIYSALKNNFFLFSPSDSRRSSKLIHNTQKMYIFDSTSESDGRKSHDNLSCLTIIIILGFTIECLGEAILNEWGCCNNDDENAFKRLHPVYCFHLPRMLFHLCEWLECLFNNNVWLKNELNELCSLDICYCMHSTWGYCELVIINQILSFLSSHNCIYSATIKGK